MQLNLDNQQSAVCHAAKVGERVRVFEKFPSCGNGDFEQHPDFEGEWFQWIDGERGESFHHPFGPIGGTVEVKSSYFEQDIAEMKLRYQISKLKLISVTVEFREGVLGWCGELERVGE